MPDEGRKRELPPAQVGVGEGHLSTEGALDLTKRFPLTRQSWRWILVTHRVNSIARLGTLSQPMRLAKVGYDRERQKLRHELGVRLKTPPTGDPARRSLDRGSARTVRDLVQIDARGQGLEQTIRRVVTTLKLEGRRQAKLYLGSAGGYGQRQVSTDRSAARFDGLCDRESANLQGARIVSRLQKLVRCIFLTRTWS